MTAVETYEYSEPTELNVVPAPSYQNLLEAAPTLETRNGLRTYDLVCLAVEDPETGEVCIVRKSHEVDSADPTDWLVVRWKPEDDRLIHNEVIHANTESGDEGDKITLVLSPEVSHHGPFTLSFGVDDMYRPNRLEARLEHQKYYGRGVGRMPERYQDAFYTKHLPIPEGNAKVYDLARERELRQSVGHSAVASF